MSIYNSNIVYGGECITPIYIYIYNQLLTYNFWELILTEGLNILPNLPRPADLSIGINNEAIGVKGKMTMIYFLFFVCVCVTNGDLIRCSNLGY